MRGYALRLAIVALILLALSFVPVPRAYAGVLPCIASPGSGPVGTTFTLTATGFTPNTNLWLYAVDPSGAAFSSPLIQGFGGATRSDETGTVVFTFSSRFQQIFSQFPGQPDVISDPIDRELGTWTLVAQETGLGGVTVAQANCQVTITGGGGATLLGAVLTVTPQTGFSDTNFTLIGTGFAPDEIVNTWLSPPYGCDTFGYNLDRVDYIHAASSAYTYRSARTDASGSFSLQIFANTPYFCTGQWAVSAQALRSGLGGVATFNVTGHPNPATGDTLIFVSPSVGPSRGGTFTITGFGYLPHEPINCWFTRPEGTVREFTVFSADASGSFSFTFSTDFDHVEDVVGPGSTLTPTVIGQYNLGSLGQHAMTCKGQQTNSIAITTFTVVGGPSDP